MESTASHIHSISPGELPPPPPRACFGRSELIEKIIGFAENLTPIALIGAGGIGKTSIALTVLHHDRIMELFGENRRFIRCDQFPASRTNFLARLSQVIGAGVKNPEDLTALRPFLSSRRMIIFLDNAESILDPHGTGAQEIHSMVEELSEFKTICLCITSRISTVPRHCKRPVIPTLSMESACEIFYGICDNGGRSDTISNLLKRLDFHALSITLLATTASHNMWDYDRLAREWDTHRVQVLQTDYNESIAATVELSLASPTFRKLGPDARDLLGVIAFFPQGINENNLDWLFPTVSNRRTSFDKLCVLSLTYRSNGFITMLAPLRDYLRPKNPSLSPLLLATKKCYFSRLSVHVKPTNPGFKESQWIATEDANVEHLLDVFMSADADSADVWAACCDFMWHLLWHKPRLVVLGSKIEGLPDSHHSKPKCLLNLSLLFDSVGNYTERKRLLTHTLKIWRERGDDLHVAQTLRFISGANRRLGRFKEGIKQVEEASEIYQRLNRVSGQTQSLEQLARLLYGDGQLEAAEKAASRALSLVTDKDNQYRVCQFHLLLGEIHRSKGETEKAISRSETALGIASSFNWDDQQFWCHHSLARLFSTQGRFEEAHVHVEHAESHTRHDAFHRGHANLLRAEVWCRESKFEEARSGAVRAIEVFEKLGAPQELAKCRALLRAIEAETPK